MNTLTLSLISLVLFAGIQINPAITENGLKTDVPNVHQFSVKTIKGDEVNLEEYKGSVLLIVNTASKCGYTPQYKDLQELYETYKDQGLVILGFPANNFNQQEPGTNEEILEFCEMNYGITFPMFSKVSVKGDDQHELFSYLTGSGDKQEMGGVNWNFEKFVIDKEGNLVQRYRSRINPMDKKVRDVVEELLAAN